MTTHLTGEPAMGFAAKGDTLSAVNFYQTFEALFVAEYSKMVALAAAVSGDRSQAEDIAQEAFSKLNKNWDQVSRYEKPGAWMRRVTINLALSKKRKLKAESKALLGLQSDAARQGSQSTFVSRKRDDQHVWAVVKKLPKMQRSVIALHYLEDLSLKDIASVLEISPSTARVHLHRARQSLHIQLAKATESAT